MLAKRFTSPIAAAVALSCVFASTVFNVAAADELDGAMQERPNILFILADDVGREVLGCYGGETHGTPRIDRLARDGLRCTHAYVMPTCHPTRTTLLTGRYPFRIGAPQWGTFPESEEARTFAHALRSAGYATAVAGKWQLTTLEDDPQHPKRMGFDRSCLFGWHEGPRYYQPRIWQDGALRDDVDDRYGPDVYCEFLINFMRSNRDRPFFALYSMALCHEVTDDLDKPVPYGPRGRYDNYAEMVAAMDERVGRIVDALDELGLAEKTAVMFLTDNGSPAKSIISVRDGEYVEETVATRFRGELVPGGKAQLTDWGTRVPLIVRWPGRCVAGSTSDALIDASDFAPTLCELAGAAPAAGVDLDGLSFAAMLRREAPQRTWAYAEHKGRSFVRDRRWKLYSDGQFFDIDNDPDERRPLVPRTLSGEAADAHTALVAASRGVGGP